MRTFDFLRMTKVFVPLSIALVVISALLLIPQVRGWNLGIDFTGGTEFTVDFSEPVDAGAIREALAGIEVEGIDLSKSRIQGVAGANRVVITSQLDISRDQATIDRVERTLAEQFPIVEPAASNISRVAISQQVSRELTQKGWQAILLAILIILVYVSWRFRLRYAIGAIAAIVHDVLIALGVFALFQVEINIPSIAAFLTIIGYSLNDTIVIYDRIRENLKLDSRAPMREIINRSVSQSLSRTLNTSLTTFIPVVILFIFGGSVLRAFSLALFIGVIVGTYSSMYIANPILYAWSLRAKDTKKRR
jgi:preprotein translocase subunit SecF